jgi:hypothetical protein
MKPGRGLIGAAALAGGALLSSAVKVAAWPLDQLHAARGCGWQRACCLKPQHCTAQLDPALQHPATCVFTAAVVGMDVTPGSLHLATGDPSTHMLLKLSQPVHATMNASSSSSSSSSSRGSA